MSYVVKKHQNNLYVVSNKAVGPGKNAELIIVGPTSFPDYRVCTVVCIKVRHPSFQRFWKNHP